MRRRSDNIECMRHAFPLFVLLLMCHVAPAHAQPATAKWYLDPEEMADPEYRAMITRAQQRAESPSRSRSCSATGNTTSGRRR